MRRVTDRVLDLETLHLEKGGHDTPDQGLCLLEAAAYLAGEEHSDHPVCVSRVLGEFGRNVNDLLPDDKRQALKPLIPMMLGTAGDGLDEQRGYLALDWLIRTYTPAWLDLAGLAAQASQLRGLPRIADRAAARAAEPVVRESRDSARGGWAVARAVARAAAWDAARAAAWDAARDVARVAAGAAARDAAGDAARAAARVAAGDAARDVARAAAWDVARAAAGAVARAAAGDVARDVARDAAGDALKPTVTALQDSAIELFARMIRPGGDR